MEFSKICLLRYSVNIHSPHQFMLNFVALLSLYRLQETENGIQTNIKFLEEFWN